MFIALSFLIRLVADLCLFAGATFEHIACGLEQVGNIPVSAELLVLGALIFFGFRRVAVIGGVLLVGYTYYVSGNLSFSDASQDF